MLLMVVYPLLYHTLSNDLRLHGTCMAILVQASTQLPHVSECNYCMRCASEEQKATMPESPPASVFDKIFPSSVDIKAKQLKPNCTDCRGCSTQLQPLKAVMAFGQDFSVEIGASPEWIFTTGD